MRKLTVYYELRDSDDILQAMELELKAIIEKYGYRWHAQGINAIDGVRDICFEKEEN